MKRYWPEIIIAMLEIILVIIQNIDSWAGVFGRDSTTAVVRLTSIQIVIFILYALTRLGLLFTSAKAFYSEVSADLGRLSSTRYSVQPLQEDDFYDELHKRLKSCRKSAALTHLDTNPPTRLRGSPGDRYYKSLFGMIKSQETVRFQRVERASEEKIDWIQNMIDDLEGFSNFSLRCIRSSPEPRELGLISTQLIDDTYTYLVAVSKHYSAHTHRDMLVTGKELNDLWRGYYDSILWERAVPIIENGVVKVENWETLKLEMG